MSSYQGLFVVVLFVAACGGTADTGSESGGGSSQGGSNAGQNAGGSAGKGSGGANNAGSNSGGSNSGGINAAGSNVGGTGTYDERCPAHQPMGACSADDTGLSCQYEPGTGCLCYQQPQGTFGFCQRVDASCTYMPPGTAGAAGASGSAGVGGFSTKIALPPQLRCGCSAGMWLCSQGF